MEDFSTKIARILEESSLRRQKELSYSRQFKPNAIDDTRCEICDYCETTETGSWGKQTPVRVKVREDGRILCSNCAISSYELLTFWEEDDTLEGRELKPTHTYMEGTVEVQVYHTPAPTYDPLCGSYSYLADLTEEEKQRWRDEYAASLKC